MKKYLIYKKQAEGFKDVAETVKIVEKAAASHIHLLKKQVKVILDYKSAVESQLSRLLEFIRDESNPLLKNRKSGESAIIIISGDKGIVGGLYNNLINTFLTEKSRYLKVWVLGRKVKEYLDEEKIDSEKFTFNSADLLNIDSIKELSAEFFRRFKTGSFKNIDILYSKFISFAYQQPAFVSFLPFDFASEKFLNKQSGEGLPIFEPSKKSIFDSLLKKYIDIFFIGIMLEAKLSEFSARTITAENAISETNKIIHDLQLAFFKNRRSVTTQKQLESFIAHKII